MRGFQYEIFLGAKHLTAPEWQEFLLAVQRQIGSCRSWSLRMEFENHVLRYYLSSPMQLPSSLGLENFLLKPTAISDPLTDTTGWPLLHRLEDNCTALALRLQRKRLNLCSLTLKNRGGRQAVIGHVDVIIQNGQKFLQRPLLLTSPATLLSVDFNQTKNYTYKKIPKYLNLDKVAKLFSQAPNHNLLEIDPFPYNSNPAYLDLEQYDFTKHSLILGGSGMGKSKFLATMIHQIYIKHPDEYQIVIIDPHDALKQDLAHIPDRIVVDFTTPETSIDLFATHVQSISANIELMLGLFQSLIADNYNSRLERVLRYSIYLLFVAKEFNFGALRCLLTELEYRQQLLNQHHDNLPDSVAQFFLTDFQELKTKAYSEAIAPIVAFIDEMQMVSTFSQQCCTAGLEGTMQDTFLTIFSLNRLQFGDKVVRTLAGLLMQQLFLLAQTCSSDQHLLIIIDEVAIVENPILPRFLSELRKYGASVFLAGQYFAQISSSLRDSIFANTSNYYLFRTSRADANLLSQNLEIKLVGSEDQSDQAKLLASLKSRECLAQISHDGKILPIFKAHTTDCVIAEPVPSKPVPLISIHTATDKLDAASDFDFAFDDADIGDFLPCISTSRKALNH